VAREQHFPDTALGQGQHYEVYYAGSVQGVGFRYTAWSLADRFGVTGFVRNLPDGRVHLVVEGDSERVVALLDAVRQRMQDYIEDIQQTTRPAAGRFQTFEIRR
jgi:acylphosphatase